MKPPKPHHGELAAEGFAQFGHHLDLCDTPMAPRPTATGRLAAPQAKIETLHAFKEPRSIIRLIRRHIDGKQLSRQDSGDRSD